MPGVIRKLFEARRPTTVNLGFGEPGPKIPHELFDLGVERFRRETPGYPPNAGLPALREAIAAYHHYPHLTAMKNQASAEPSPNWAWGFQAGPALIIFG